MTVSELIAVLQQHNPEARVILAHYNGGYSDARAAKVVNISLQETQPYFTGPVSDAREGELSIPAVLVTDEE